MVMIFKTGDIFDSKAQALVNTVNCEGFLGKGIAFQFKKKYPEMEKDYVEVCKNGSLKPGKLHFYQTHDILIVNFPTKDKWRANSKMEYIEDGLKTLSKEIVKRNIRFIAIPPLGSGNGGLNWHDVKLKIKEYLKNISQDVIIEIYEPTDSGIKNQKEEKSNYITLSILDITNKLEHDKIFNTRNLESAIDIINIISDGDFNIVHQNKEFKKIRDLKAHYNLTNNNKLYNILRQKVISDSIEKLEKRTEPIIHEATVIVKNYVGNDLDDVKKALILSNKKDKQAIEKEVPKYITDNLLKDGILVQDIFGNIELNKGNIAKADNTKK
ncbi:ADP-ribose 1-phosphate phophatase related protein [Lactococcus lactis subsp. lactis]|nr:ADP-ribose 1-phosphate phophatase related protein [Lactococcus lactis subsp. lactis]